MAIPIENIYYLLSYSWNALEEKEKVVHESLGLSVLTGKVNVNGRTGKWVQKDFEGNFMGLV